MSIADVSTYDASVQETVRAELKAWEKAFAAANGGRRAGREDIKKNPDIAAKYKAYNRPRTDKALSKLSVTSPSPPPAKKRRSRNGANSQPKYHSPSMQAQENRVQFSSYHPSVLDPYDPPSAHATPSTYRVRDVVGPTPQRNGRVLGLFDLLSPASAKKHKTDDTPCKNIKTTPANIGTAASLGTSLSTPSKSRDNIPTNSILVSDLTSTPVARRYSRTPQSSGKRKFLDAFLTPSTRRANALADATPLSKKRLHETTPFKIRTPVPLHLQSPFKQQEAPQDPDATPAFLKRYSAPILPRRSESATEAIADLGINIETTLFHDSIPRVFQTRRKPLGRSLSEMVRSLRDAEEEKLDEEMDIMRELELENEGGADKREVVRGGKQKGRVEVNDSQTPAVAFVTDVVQGEKVQQGEMRLGADGEWGGNESEREGKAEGGEDGNGGGKRKVWKKKGQKRTTRRVRMQPRTEKWRPETTWGIGEEDDDEDQVGEEDVVGETQVANDGKASAGGDDDDAYIDDAEAGSVEEGAGESGSTKKKKRGRPPKTTTKDKNDKEAKDGEKDKKKPRKVNPAAHANFRALKIRNKNSRARGGGRFGRRR